MSVYSKFARICVVENVALIQFFFLVLRYSSVIIIPSIRHILHVDIVGIRPKSGRNAGTFRQSKTLSNIRGT